MKQLFSYVDEIDHPDIVLDRMKQTYDGYIFSKDANKHLYNPNMALYYLDYYNRKNKEPDELIDFNIRSDYDKIQNLLKIKPSQEQSDALLEIITEGEIRCRLTLSYNLQKNFSKMILFLYYFI